jgi:radical SAM superfamily enzyme with C-terminal helix-hairpin-helix motif
MILVPSGVKFRFCTLAERPIELITIRGCENAVAIRKCSMIKESVQASKQNRSAKSKPKEFLLPFDAFIG